MVVLTLLVGLTLAFANGANDTFKGVATLFGSGTTTYKKAITWATLTTALGSMTALVVARGLLAHFSGKGLVDAELVANVAFPLSVAAGAGITVLVASRLGIPISTTHSLIGALIGVGLIASSSVHWEKLLHAFVVPLMASPLLSMISTALIYIPLRRLRMKWGLSDQSCVCIEQTVTASCNIHGEQAMNRMDLPHIEVASLGECSTDSQVAGLSAQKLLDSLHFLSAGAVSFARGLNDTPKIAALLLAGSALTASTAIQFTGIFMLIGAVLFARRVGETMSHKVTDMNAGQGFTANAVTSVLVIGASFLGLPVSTTHVSCGSLFGIGAQTGGAHWSTIWSILLAWVITLPMSAAFAALAWVMIV